MERVCEGGVCAIRPRRSGVKRNIPVSKGILSLFLLTLSILMLDMSGGRLRYHYVLVNSLSPVKSQIQAEMYEYHGDVPEELRNCHAYDRQQNMYVQNCTLSACEQNALLLSERRQAILASVRAAHPISRIVAEIFDHNRGMEQEKKIERLFNKKSCEGVIASSDKTNWKMDLAAIFTFPLGILILLKSIKMFVSVYRVGPKVD